VTAYTDATKIAAYLGVTLTAAQITQAAVVADAATLWIERYTGRSWQTASPIANELHTIIGDRVFLSHRPVVAVSAVKTRGSYEDATETTLTSDQYELLDATNGVLLLEGWSSGDELALVSYTHTMTTVPADVGLAATMLASAWLSGSVVPGSIGAQSIAVGQNDVAITFGSGRTDVPAEALSILAGYRTVVIA